jgi:hypothetical protein
MGRFNRLALPLLLLSLSCSATAGTWLTRQAEPARLQAFPVIGIQHHCLVLLLHLEFRADPLHGIVWYQPRLERIKEKNP